MFFKLKSISKQYSGKTILDDISFEVDKGDIVSIIGPSGVGKTTLLKIIAGLEKATAGGIVYEVNPQWSIRSYSFFRILSFSQISPFMKTLPSDCGPEN
jgi:ABC-type nitrate/sulfonate/bicarbonate transport system ATPase subunit